ncbi:MAG: sensor histidine kinase [Rhodoferax sp.]
MPDSVGRRQCQIGGDCGLRHAQECYREVVEYLGEGMFVVQRERIVFANRQASEILRIAPQELIGADPVAWVHPDDQAQARSLRAQLRAQPDSAPVLEIRHIGSDGVVRWLSVRPRVVPWEGDPATLTFFSEVTERHAITEALHRSEERYRHVVEHSGEGMLVVQDGRFVFVNRRATELVRMEMADMLREGYLHRIHPEDRALVDERRRRRLAGEPVPDRYEIRIVWPDGQVRWLDIGVTVVPWDGAPATLTFFSDVTERRLADEALRSSWAEREAILNNALVGMVLTVQRRIQWVNRRFADMLGYAIEELLGQDGRVLYQDEAQWVAHGREQYAVLRDSGTYSGERQLRRRDGSLLWVRLDGQCVQPNTPDAGVIWTLLDITARIQAEAQMRMALEQQRDLNELRARFVAMTSHEFRTPLATILSSAELLRFYGERLPQQERLEVLRTIEDGVHRMAHMLDRVLLLGRAEAKMLEFRPAATDLHGLCQALVEELQPQLQGTRCRLVAQWSGLPAQAVVDEKLLRHIFSNLLSNAVKYSPRGGEVRFQAQAQPPRALVFSVSDQGIGIPAQELPHLFQSFHRASNVGTIMGTGLGLAIVKNAVELHGGQIAVDSEPMQGTRFTVVLPCETEPMPD